MRSTDDRTKQTLKATEGAMDNKAGNNPERAKSSGQQPMDRSMGDALRAVYHEAIDEQIPAEMLDLLKKLD